ncbi:hypothetical protein [Domibacillus robiginosus]|uniref:hypothetical protein n=1 Tax=Domibacillus robiginosus TaxID=1071054 RepID=UPI0012E01242|nr:hypothetical protein [Domibacillus robiginosus]
MNRLGRRRPGSSAFHGAGAEPDCAWRLHRSQLPARPIGVYAARTPPSGLRQNWMELIWLYVSFDKEKMAAPSLLIDL